MPELERRKRGSAMWFMQITAFFESTTICTNMISVLKAYDITRKMHFATWLSVSSRSEES